MLLKSFIQNLLLTSSIMENFQTAIDTLFPQLNHVSRAALFYGGHQDCDFVRTFSQNIVKYNFSLVLINYKDYELHSLQFLGDRYLNIFLFQNVSSMYLEMSSLKTKKFKYMTSYLIVLSDPLNFTTFNTTNTSVHSLQERNIQIQVIMKHLWKFKIIDMVLLCWNDNHDLFGYTLNPFLHKFEIKLFEIKLNGKLIDHNNKKYYWNKTKKLNFYNVTAFMYHTPPKVLWLPSIYRGPGPFYFGGRDGLLSSVTSKMLGTRFTYITFRTTQVLNFKMTNGNSTGMRSIIMRRVVPGDDFIPYNLKQLDPKSIDNISAVIQTYSPDLIMMSKLLTYKENPDYDQLYPHEFDHICVLVPNLSKQIPFSINKIFLPLPIKLVPVTLVVFIIVWKFFRDQLKFRNNEYSLVLMYTMGMFLATGADHRTTNLTERILIMSLFLFSQITSVAIAGLLYQSIVVPEQTSNIQTLDELAKTNYTILINKDFSENIAEWGNNLNPEIKKKFRAMDENALIDMILKQNTTYAYVLSKMRAKLILQKKQLWVNKHNLFHLVDECLFPGLMSFEIKKGLPLQFQIERYIEYVIQHGFLDIYMRLTAIFIFGQKDSNVYMPGYIENYSKSANPLTLGELNSLIILYAIGICISIGVFIMEHFRVHLMCNKLNRRRNLAFQR